MGTAKKLKGSPYSVDEDYSLETRNIRKRLWEYAKTQGSDNSNKIKLKHDKLILNGKAYTWDKEKQVVVPAVKQSRRFETKKSLRRDLVAVVVNCRSIVNKVDEFASLLESVKADIVFGTESWLYASIGDAEVFPKEFSLSKR